MRSVMSGWRVCLVILVAALAQLFGLAAPPLYGQTTATTSSAAPSWTVLASLLLAPPAMPAGAAQPHPFCAPGQTPEFAFGFRALKDVLEGTMGEPLECEHTQPWTGVSGDVVQPTTTGLAYWRNYSNTSSFTDGWEHWALTSDGLLYWTGRGFDPPPPFREFCYRPEGLAIPWQEGVKARSSRLCELVRAYHQGALREAAERGDFELDGDSVLVRMRVQPGEATTARRAVEAVGGRVTGGFGDYLEAYVPVPALPTLFQHTSILIIDETARALPA